MPKSCIGKGIRTSDLPDVPPDIFDDYHNLKVKDSLLIST